MNIFGHGVHKRLFQTVENAGSRSIWLMPSLRRTTPLAKETVYSS